LALQQDGNPLSNFEVIEDSITVQYNDTNQDYTISENTTLDDLLDDNNLFDFTYKSEFNLGVEEVAKFEINASSQMIDLEETSSINLAPTVTETADGSLIVTTYTIMTPEEYYQYLNDALLESVSENELSYPLRSRNNIGYNIESPALEGVDFLVSVSTKVNDVCELTGGASSKGLTYFGYMYDATKIYAGGVTTSIVLEDPRLDDNAKVGYTSAYVAKSALTMLQWVVGAWNPLAGFVFSMASIPLENWIDDMQNAAIEDGYARYQAIYGRYIGHQCTNRGLIRASFYAPDFNSDQKPSLHTSGRMHGGGYVNKEDTNYDISLNGKPAGEANNTGLTDIFMHEIPTDNLRPGEENEIVFDYDTNPGSHSVATETEITLLYPADTDIAYIDQPDGLQDIRPKPDFRIYEENIYTDGDPILHEPTTVSFNVYNTGSRGGWFNISCTDGNGNELHSEENYYLAAFCQETFQINWTPEQTSTQFTVTLENTSIGLDERNSDNNSATRTITARERQVPTFIGFQGYSSIYANEPFSLVANLNQCKDFVGVSFSLGGQAVPCQQITGSGEKRSCSLAFEDGLPEGSYTLTAAIQYQSSADKISEVERTYSFSVRKRDWVIPSISVPSSETLLYNQPLSFSVSSYENVTKAEVSVDNGTFFAAQLDEDSSSEYRRYYTVDLSGYESGKHSISINVYYRGETGEELSKLRTVEVTLLSESDSQCVFALPEQIIEPQITLYCNSYRTYDAEIEPVGGGTYRLLKTLDMVKNPGIYTIVISHSSGILITKLEDLHDTISETDCRNVSTMKTENDQIAEASITRIPVGSSEVYVDLPVSLDSTLRLTPGLYKLAVSGNVNGMQFSRTIDVDVTAQDQVINLSSFVLAYYLDINQAGSSSYNVSLRTCNSTDNRWSSQYLIRNNTADGLLRCYTSSEYAIEAEAESNRAYLLAYSNQEVYFIRLKDSESLAMLAALNSEDETIVLDRSTLHKISIVSATEDLEVSSVRINWDNIDISLYGDTIYVPTGEYTLEASLTDGGQMFSSSTTVSVTEDSTVTVGKDLEAVYSDVSISWPFAGSATVSCHNYDENWSATFDNLTSGSTVKVLNGTCNFQIRINCQETPLTFSSERNIEEGNNSIAIGNQLTGGFEARFSESYDPETQIQFSVQNVLDADQNRLDTNYFDTPLSGNVIFTNVKDANQIFTVPITAESLYSIPVNVPETPGTYRISVMLTTENPENRYVVTINDSASTESGAGSYQAGETVVIAAGTRSGYIFSGWSSTDNEIVFADATNATTTFVMPARPVTVTAQWTRSGEDFDGNGGSSGGSHTPSTPTVSTDTTTEDGTPTTTTSAEPPATVSGDTASATVNTSMGNEIVKQATANNSDTVVIAPKISRDVTKTEVSIPAATVSQIGNQTSASLTIATPVASVSIPNGGLGSLASAGGTVTVTVEHLGSSIEFTVAAGGMPVQSIPGGVTLIVPVTNTTPGTVTVLVHEDGTREVVRKSVAHNGTLVIPLDGSAKLEIVDNSKSFADVPVDNWAADAVSFVGAHELFNGTAPGRFSPVMPMSRGMLAQVLYNLESNPKQTAANVFTDIDNSKWYAEAVSWAAGRGIVGGYGNGTFGPNDPITREQLAVMLWRYAGSPAATDKELYFNDTDEISSFALDAMRWAVENGVLNGYGDGRLNPQGQATRAQVAQMLKNYLER